MTAWLEAAAPRVSCPQHGVVTAAVPWARHGAGHTRFFDDQVAWLAAACSKTTITALMRISWRTVGHIIARVSRREAAAADPLAGLRRIGIDEISYKKGHKYLVVVVDHDSGRLVLGRARPGHQDRARVLRRPRRRTRRAADPRLRRRRRLDRRVVAERAPQAVLCADPFHVVSWATDALDEVRREVWRTARQAGAATPRSGPQPRPSAPSAGDARDLKRARYALWKNPENLTGRPASQARLDREDPPLPLPRLPAQGRTAAAIPAQRRRRQRTRSTAG